MNQNNNKLQFDIFRELLDRSKRISRDEFSVDFGGVPSDIVGMLNSKNASTTLQQARETMEKERINSYLPELRSVKFGSINEVSELQNGEVAAIDGTFALPIQKYSAGQAVCVGIGSLSHCRPMEDSLHFWSSNVFLSEASDTSDFIEREKLGLFGIYPTTYLRYFEIEHSLEIEEKFLFLDGPVFDESLISRVEGINLYERLYQSEKQVIGIMKNIMNPIFTKFARALKSGEVYVVMSLQEHLDNSNTRKTGISNKFMNEISSDIYRGVFKPRKKAFGFEVHKNHFEKMLTIMAADCQLNNPGHEIPFLLNRIDEEVRSCFNPQILKDRISLELAINSEELFFEETDERAFRSIL